MKIAYLILAFDKPDHVMRLCSVLSSADSSIFLHIDAKSQVHFPIPERTNFFRLPNPVVINWGGYSIVEASLRLLTFASNTDLFDYFVLMSGTDYPLHSNERIKQFFAENQGSQFINLWPMPHNGKDWYRTDYYYLETDTGKSLGSRIKNFTNGLIKKLELKKKLPTAYSKFTLYGGSTWWALSRDAVEYILNFVRKSKSFVKFYRFSFAPDELFFHTILGNSPFSTSIKESVTFAHWSDKNSPHPTYLDETHLELLREKAFPQQSAGSKIPKLFARKFGPGSEKLLDIIDEQFRKEN